MPKTRKRCKSGCSDRCKLKQIKTGLTQYATVGLMEDANIWCLGCAVIEWTKLNTPINERQSSFKLCEVCGQSKAHSGKFGEQPTHCSDHKLGDMVDVTHKRCEKAGCKRQPSFGKFWGKATHCEEDKLDGMEDVTHKRCEKAGCKKQASFGKFWGKATHCWEDKLDGMEDVRSKRCEKTGCKKQASFGKFWGKATHCKEDKLDGMEDVVSKRCEFEGCDKQASSGTTLAPRTHCASHVRKMWEEQNIPLPNRLNSMGKMPTLHSGYSRESIDWLSWLVEKLGMTDMRHAESRDADGIIQGEYDIAIKGRKYKADGFSASNNCIFEYHGCYFHGCQVCYANEPEKVNTRNGKTMLQLAAETAERETSISAAGYKLIRIWAHEFDQIMEDEDARALHLNFVRKILGQDPIAPKRRAGTLDDYFSTGRL